MFSIFKRKSEPQPLFIHTDIHCHIVPGIDDGAPDLASALQLAKGLEELGFTRVFASPHITQATFENSAETITGPYEQLRDGITREGIGIELHHWAENRIDDLLYKNIKENKLFTIPGNRLLIENSFMQEPWNLEQLVFDLQVRDLTPILAHPERYHYYRHHPEHLKRLVDGGLSLQVNILSLAGYYGDKEKKAAEELISMGLVRYLGTDVHRSAHIDSIKNYLATKDYTRHRAALEGRILNDTI